MILICGPTLARRMPRHATRPISQFFSSLTSQVYATLALRWPYLLRPQILRRSSRARRFAPARSCPRPPLPPVYPRFPRLPRSRVPHERRDVSRPPHRLLMRDARDLRPPGALGDAPMRALDPRPRRAPRAHPPPSTKRQASACACMLPPCVMMRERMIRLDGRIRGPCLHDHQHLVMARRKMVMDLHLSSSSSSSTSARRTVRMRASPRHHLPLPDL